MENVIELINVNKKYTKFSLKDINFKLRRGSIMGLVGENGAGKTTILKLILGAIRKDSGQIKIFDKEIEKWEHSEKEKIGVVLDENYFPETLNLFDLEKILKKIYKKWDEIIFEKYVSKFNLNKRKSIKEYSKGMKMKLNIAIALSHKAEILILDEATGGLDPAVRDEVLDILLDFIQDEKNSVLISSHIISDLEKVCDYITFINKGTMVFSESKEAILENYGILKCSNTEFDILDKKGVLTKRQNTFGTTALVDKRKIFEDIFIDEGSLEEIIVNFIKGNEV